MSWLIIHLAELGLLVVKTREMIDMFSKAKAAKLIRELVDRFLDMKATTGKEVHMTLCNVCGLYYYPL